MPQMPNAAQNLTYHAETVQRIHHKRALFEITCSDIAYQKAFLQAEVIVFILCANKKYPILLYHTFLKIAILT